MIQFRNWQTIWIDSVQKEDTWMATAHEKALRVFSHQENASQPLRETPGAHRAGADRERHEPSHNTRADLKQKLWRKPFLWPLKWSAIDLFMNQPLIQFLDVLCKHGDENIYPIQRCLCSEQCFSCQTKTETTKWRNKLQYSHMIG